MWRGYGSCRPRRSRRAGERTLPRRSPVFQPTRNGERLPQALPAAGGAESADGESGDLDGEFELAERVQHYSGDTVVGRLSTEHPDRPESATRGTVCRSDIRGPCSTGTGQDNEPASGSAEGPQH